MKNIFTKDSGSSASPDSIRRTVREGFSLSRLATTLPAVPAPTTMKSNVTVKKKLFVIGKYYIK